MFLIPGFLISLLTFPGVIMQQFVTRLICDLCGVPVYEVCYMKLGNSPGWVVHRQVTDLRTRFFLTLGPMIVCSFLCAIISMPFVMSIGVGYVPGTESTINLLLMYIGISIGMHAFPSDQSLTSLLDAIKQGKQGFNIMYLIAWPWILFMRIGNFLRIFWFDAIYAIGVSVIPTVMFSAFFLGT